MSLCTHARNCTGVPKSAPCRTDAVQSSKLEGATAGCNCTKRALTVKHMATNTCKNFSPVNRLTAKSSCNWWLCGRGHHHSRINRCYPLALTCHCFFFFSFPVFLFLFEHSLTQYTLQTRPWTTGEHSYGTMLCHQYTNFHFLHLLWVPQLTVRIRAKWIFSLSLNVLEELQHCSISLELSHLDFAVMGHVLLQQKYCPIWHLHFSVPVLVPLALP